MTIALRSESVFSHDHIKEDLSSQADGANLVFVTTHEYEPGTLVVYQAGLAMLNGSDNDFLESGPKEFTWVNDVIGAPAAGCSLWAYYQRKIT